MGRRPQEDDGEQQQAFDGDIAADSRPPNHRRERAGCAADDDILRGPALQPHRVNEDIKADGHCQQRACGPIDEQAQCEDGSRRKERAERQRVVGADTATRNWARGRALHLGVDVGVVPHVECARCASADRDREDCDEGEHRVDRTRGGDHAGQRRQDDERHHAGLHQCEEVANGRADDACAGDISLDSEFRHTR